jgi:hypothetical protein
MRNYKTILSLLIIAAMISCDSDDSNGSRNTHLQISFTNPIAISIWVVQHSLDGSEIIEIKAPQGNETVEFTADSGLFTVSIVVADLNNPEVQTSIFSRYEIPGGEWLLDNSVLDIQQLDVNVTVPSTGNYNLMRISAPLVSSALSDVLNAGDSYTIPLPIFANYFDSQESILATMVNFDTGQGVCGLVDYNYTQGDYQDITIGLHNSMEYITTSTSSSAYAISSAIIPQNSKNYVWQDVLLYSALQSDHNYFNITDIEMDYTIFGAVGYNSTYNATYAYDFYSLNPVDDIQIPQIRMNSEISSDFKSFFNINILNDDHSDMLISTWSSHAESSPSGNSFSWTVFTPISYANTTMPALPQSILDSINLLPLATASISLIDYESTSGYEEALEKFNEMTFAGRSFIGENTFQFTKNFSTGLGSPSGQAAQASIFKTMPCLPTVWKAPTTGFRNDIK